MQSHTNTSVSKGLAENTYHGISKSFSMIFNSALASYKSPSGSQFQVNLNTPLQIPKNAASCQIGLFQANIWNSSPNILVGKNNMFYYRTNGIRKFVQLEQGLYSLDDLNITLGELIYDKYGDAKNTFVLFGNSATQKVNITYTYANCQIDFTEIHSLKDILGFNSAVYPDPTTQPAGSTAGQVVFAPNLAALNQINAFLVTTDLIENGLPVNTRSASILASVPITSKPNSLITYEPQQTIWVPCDHLIGKMVYSINCRLTDELLQDIIVIEDFNFSITIQYSY